MKIRTICLCGLCSIVVTGNTYASNGAQLTGYGAKSAAMGGASVAFPQDSMAAATNSAGMAEVGTRVDGDIQLLYDHSNTTFLSEDNKGKGTVIIPIPEFGINYQLDDKWTLGFATKGSGLGFKYDDPLLPIPGLKKAKGSFIQVVGLPTLGYKVNDQLSVGVSLALAAQRFRAQGIPTATGGEIPSHSYQMAYGVGWQAGVLWKANDYLSFGAAYASKIHMSKLDGYKDDLLAAADGSIDVPEQYSFGLAIKPTEKLTFALDWQHIAWDNVASFHRLFAWRSQDVYRAGVAYQFNDEWTVRTGVSYARRQFDSDDTAANILLVGINSNAASFGLTKTFHGGSELTLGYEYDFGSTSKGTGPSAGSSIDTDFGFLTVGYGWKF
ncbi:outer membrane protein transport protein [Pseudomonas grimontii]|uniref:OmpP1/FadL family transporter n=1 Tax=Pseudomonas grimontii TaxID=129847 RepID=UPI0028E9E344|nr:outer membrane protein transport protein [Pseudomonas grimontii]